MTVNWPIQVYSLPPKYKLEPTKDVVTATNDGHITTVTTSTSLANPCILIGKSKNVPQSNMAQDTMSVAASCSV